MKAYTEPLTGTWPEVWLLFATYSRTQAALRSIRSLKRYLHYPNLHWHICDDGSGNMHIKTLAAAIGGDVTWHTRSRMSGKDWDVGGNINKGIEIASNHGAQIHLMNFDDFALVDDLDLCPMVDVLNAHSNVGMIRLAYAVPGLSGLISCYHAPILHNDYLWLRLIRKWSSNNPWHTDNYIISMMPYVAHKRFFEVYGPFPENKHPGETETGMNRRYADSGEDTPQVLFPIGQAVTYIPYREIARRQRDYLEAHGDIDAPIFEDI